MKTFTVKIAGKTATAQQIREAIWQATDLEQEEISVEDVSYD